MTATDPRSEVRDWSTDFDILDPDYVADPAPVWAELRERCPIAHTDRYGSTWLPTRYNDLAAIAHDVEHFSSRDIAVITPGRELNPEAAIMLIAPPITSDPPVHTWARRMLLPRFGPSRIEELTPITHALADELIDGFAATGRADAAQDYAQHIPVRVIARMLGVPLEDEDIFTSWAVTILQQGFQNIQGATDAVLEVIDYFGAKLDERERVPERERPDDLITMLVEARHEGDPLDDRHRIGSCFLLLLAGIDTTWSSIGSGLYHLASRPQDQARLRAEPELMTSAIEEILRFYSPVTMARYVAEDTEFNGCPMRKGDKILMAFPAGNRDPEHFDRPDEFVIDRQRNRHFAFGSGIHRCLGSNLARMELRVAIERFLDRIPTFELADPGAVTWSGGQVRGPRSVSVRW
ncbi:cytochrome P450 [Actinomarinicola tropica]|uniref:Cytochrome P450 n=1 Tax=Actinomarinicola tropica TaxID=2789776 RepID=A0A5Q2RHJ3_9ACTN|nr:cytochrome P450 [Actinomarinicola tropica]QGG94021.1 cytochrome P450 [Actinomarinicola tropica]